MNVNRITLGIDVDRVNINIMFEDGSIGPLLIDVGYCHSERRLQSTIPLSITFDTIIGLNEEGSRIATSQQTNLLKIHDRTRRVICDLLNISESNEDECKQMTFTNMRVSVLGDAKDIIMDESCEVKAIVRLCHFDRATHKLHYEPHHITILRASTMWLNRW